MSYDNQYRPGPFGYLPVVTKNIIIINVILFAATYLLEPMGINLYRIFGLHHHLAPDFKPHQFVTYIFMHGSFMHIFFNMFGVYIFGQVLEQVWGPKRYLIFYILTGLGAALCQYLIMHFEIMDTLNTINNELDNSYISSADRTYLIDYKYSYLNKNIIVGASGSLFGLLGGFGMLFPNRELYLYFFIPIKAKWLVIVYGGLEILAAFQNNPSDPVAHFAHIGGLLVGVLLVILWRRDRKHFY